jgi:hypothetical protein
VSRDFCFRIFSRIIFPQDPKIALGSFQIFVKIQVAPPVSMTPVVNMPAVPLVFVNAGGKFASSINNTGGKLPPVSATSVVKLPPVYGNNIRQLTP